MALSEVSWSGAFLLGVPLVGWMIARADWNSPFTPLALLGLGCALVMRFLVPPDQPDNHDRASLQCLPAAPPLQDWRSVC